MGEQVLNWSGVPVAHLRPAVFQENPLVWELPAKSIADFGTILLPLGRSRTNPVAVNDVAEVVAAMFLDPSKYAGREVELTGPRSASMYDLVKEYSSVLGRPVRYVEISLES